MVTVIDDATMWRTSKRKLAESVTARRNLAKQYERLATLVSFANLAHEFELKNEMATDLRNGKIHIRPIEDKVIERIGKQMWKAAAKQSAGLLAVGFICGVFRKRSFLMNLPRPASAKSRRGSS